MNNSLISLCILAKKAFAPFVIICLLLSFLSFSPSSVNAVEAEADAYCKTSDLHVMILNTHTITQTFIPTFNRLSKLHNSVLVTGGKISVTMRNSSGDKLMTGEYANGPMDQTISFDPVSVVPGQTYTIYYTGSPTTNIHGSEDPNCYKNGEALLDGAPMSTIKDLDFTVYGYNETAPSLTPTPTSSVTITPGSSGTSGTTRSTTNTGITTGSGAAPSARTSTSFQPPTNLKITQESNYAKMTWTKSTSTVDGYKIFRKETGSDYKEVAVANNTTEKMNDTQVISGINYTYMLRAYRGNDQSVNSNEASFTLSQAKTATQSTEKSSQSWYQNIWLWVGAGFVIVVLGINFLWLRKIKSVTSKPNK